jgi:SAM-dependent methyltransferase
VERLEERYREHHRSTRSSEFVFAADVRPALFAQLVGGPGRRVLDLGCRYGALTRAYVEGNDVVGVDIDREALAEAAKLGIETRWADVEQPLDFPDASFDVVVAGELLEHLRDPELVVREARRVLKPGGSLVGSVPNGFRLKNRLVFLLGRPPEPDPTHLHLFSAGDVRGLLRDFDDVELRFVAGRFVPLHGRLFANLIVFSANRPADQSTSAAGSAV